MRSILNAIANQYIHMNTNQHTCTISNQPGGKT
jgi:hypothetical protein